MIEMITNAITKARIEKWKQLYDNHIDSLYPNRKTGEELNHYFKSKYSFQILESQKFKLLVEATIMENEYAFEKLPLGKSPQICCYKVDDVYLGIDLLSGEFHVECEEMKKAIPLYDDLFVYRGLDEFDLKNYAMVGQFIELSQR